MACKTRSPTRAVSTHLSTMWSVGDAQDRAWIACHRPWPNTGANHNDDGVTWILRGTRATLDRNYSFPIMLIKRIFRLTLPSEFPSVVERGASTRWAIPRCANKTVARTSSLPPAGCWESNPEWLRARRAGVVQKDCPRRNVGDHELAARALDHAPKSCFSVNIGHCCFTTLLAERTAWACPGGTSSFASTSLSWNARAPAW